MALTLAKRFILPIALAGLVFGDLEARRAGRELVFPLVILSDPADVDLWTARLEILNPGAEPTEVVVTAFTSGGEIVGSQSVDVASSAMTYFNFGSPFVGWAKVSAATPILARLEQTLVVGPLPPFPTILSTRFDLRLDPVEPNRRHFGAALRRTGSVIPSDTGIAVAFPSDDPGAVAAGTIRFRTRTGETIAERHIEIAANGWTAAFFSELIPEVVELSEPQHLITGSVEVDFDRPVAVQFLQQVFGQFESIAIPLAGALVEAAE